MALWSIDPGYTINNVNYGTAPNDGTGDDIRDAFIKVNKNFGNISEFLGNSVGTVGLYNLNVAYNLNAINLATTNFFVANATGTAAAFTDTITANTFVANSGGTFTGNLITNSIIPAADGLYDLGSPTRQFRKVYYQQLVSSATVQSTDAGQIIIHANATIGDVKDVGIIGNVSHHYTSNTYAFFGYQYQTNNFVYKLSPTSAADPVTGNAVVYNGVYGNVQFGSQLLSNNTVSTSPTTGALIVRGGVGIGGNVNVGGSISAGNLNVTGSIFANGLITTSNGTVLTTGTVGDYKLFLGGVILGNVIVTSTYDAYTQSNAALVVSGGIGVGANVNAGGLIGPYYGQVQTSSQPNITSVGTLDNIYVSPTGRVYGNVQATTIGATYITVSGGIIDATSSTIETGALYVSGIFSASGVSAATIGNVGATVTGTNLIGTNGYVGTVSAGSVLATTIGNTGTTLTGTLSTAAQPNITSIGQLGSLAVATSIKATTVNATTIGNIGSNVVGSGAYLANLSSSSVQGTVATANVAVSIALQASSANASFYPTLTDKTSGNAYPYTAAGFTVNPSTGNVSATNFIGGLYGSVLAPSQPAITSVGVLNNLSVVGNLTVVGNIVGFDLYDGSQHVITSSTGSGNLTIVGNTISLATTGPGATGAGSATNIPSLQIDAYGRVVSLGTQTVSTTFALAGNTGIGSINSSGITTGVLTIGGANGVTAAVSTGANAASTTVTINTPQDIRTTASPSFANITVGGNIISTTGTLTTAGGQVDKGFVISNIAQNNTQVVANVNYHKVVLSTLNSDGTWNSFGTVGNVWVQLPNVAIDGTEIVVTSMNPISNCYIYQATVAGGANNPITYNSYVGGIDGNTAFSGVFTGTLKFTYSTQLNRWCNF